ncbi:Hypothetical predicted protein [Cloeon dipterum]|nr:Hypothetical predicted protein [Cloeon dipterum]
MSGNTAAATIDRSPIHGPNLMKMIFTIVCSIVHWISVVPDSSILKMLLSALPLLSGMYVVRFATALNASVFVFLRICHICSVTECHVDVPDLTSKEHMHLKIASALFVIGSVYHLWRWRKESTLKQD